MDALPVRSSDAPYRLVSVVAITIALSACEQGARESAPPSGGATASAAASVENPYAERPTPGCEFGAPVESIARTRFNECARRLEFVQDPHLSDEQPLIYPADRGRPLRVGPTARIEPERGATALGQRQVHEGRVIARIISDGPYEPLGIRRGIQYVWIDSTRAGWRALMIPANDADSITRLGVAVRRLPHLGRAPVPPAAGWRFDPERGTFFNGGCQFMCCSGCPLRPPGDCPGFPATSLRATAYGGVEGVPAMGDTVGQR
jgi:hypothetical protein